MRHLLPLPAPPAAFRPARPLRLPPLGRPFARRGGAGRGGGGAGDHRTAGAARLPGIGRGAGRVAGPARGRTAAAAGAACLVRAGDGPGRQRLACRRLHRRPAPPRLQPGPHAGQGRAQGPGPRRRPAAATDRRARHPTSATRAPTLRPRGCRHGPGRRRPARHPPVEAALAHAPGRPDGRPDPGRRERADRPARPRRPDALPARLRGGTAAPPSTESDPRGLLRAWAQGP